MASFFGLFEIPDFNISGFISSTWWYLFIVCFVTFIIIITIVLVFFFKNYRYKIEFYEKIAGGGYQRIAVRRARLVKLGMGGVEILKVIGGLYLSAYGRKVGTNRYMYVKGQDGYWYNSIHGDFDAKMGMLDIEPIERDVRMFYVSIDRLAQQTYGKQSFLEKYGIHLMLFAFLIIALVGTYIIAGKVNEGLQVSAQTQATNQAVLEGNQKVLVALENLLNQNPTIRDSLGNQSGIIPVT